MTNLLFSELFFLRSQSFFRLIVTFILRFTHVFTEKYRNINPKWSHTQVQAPRPCSRASLNHKSQSGAARARHHNPAGWASSLKLTQDALKTKLSEQRSFHPHTGNEKKKVCDCQVIKYHTCRLYTNIFI